MAAAALLVALLPAAALTEVLKADDAGRVAAIRAQFATVMSDLAQSAQRPDLSGPERECLGSVLQDMMQVTGELAGYQNLLTIETSLDASGDDGTVRPLMQFAASKASDLMRDQRDRLRETPEPCLRMAVAGSRTRGLLQFLDTTIATLDGVRSRL